MENYNHKDTNMLSFSFIKQFARSNAHAKAYLDAEFKSTPALEFGKAFHSYMAGDYNAECVTESLPEPGRSRATKANKQYLFEMSQMEKQLIKLDDFFTIETMHDSIAKHPIGKKLLAASGDVEQVYDLDRRKCKADKVTDKLIIDWKSIADLDINKIRYTIENYLYNGQAAWYNSIIGKDFAFVFVEKKPPFDVAVIVLTNNSMMMQESHELVDMLELKAHLAIANNIWDGQENNIIYL